MEDVFGGPMNPGPQVAYLSDDDADVANGLPGERRQCGGKLDDLPCQSPRSGNALVADFPVLFGRGSRRGAPGAPPVSALQGSFAFYEYV
jgi:hypothetical protein